VDTNILLLVRKEFSTTYNMPWLQSG